MDIEIADADDDRVFRAADTACGYIGVERSCLMIAWSTKSKSSRQNY